MNQQNQSVLWADQSQNTPSSDVMQYLAGEDIHWDKTLFLYDIKATEAHISGLQRINLITSEELHLMTSSLNQLKSDYQSGQFLLDDRFEDGHSAIEFYLIEHLGDLGKKAHTGRSRNDQVLTCLRLYMLDHLMQAKDHIRSIAQQLLTLAKTHTDTLMPGYTHLQQAMPNTVAVWLLSLAESFADDGHLINDTLRLISSSPLGSASGFGVPLDLQREYTAEKLGFERVQVNPVYAQNSRGKFELFCLQSLYHVMLDIKRFCWDLSLFCTQEFGFIQLNATHTTGSSIMPNKNNPDVIEVMRASASILEGSISQVQSLVSLPSGYHRDLQLTKAPLIRGVKVTIETLQLLPGLLNSLQIKENEMLNAIGSESLATDLAYDHLKQGVAFRDAYLFAKNNDSNDITFKDSVNSRVSLGGAANPGIDLIQKRIDSIN
jgi:argininosuccinate lyase